MQLDEEHLKSALRQWDRFIENKRTMRYIYWGFIQRFCLLACRATGKEPIACGFVHQRSEQIAWRETSNFVFALDYWNVSPLNSLTLSFMSSSLQVLLLSQGCQFARQDQTRPFAPEWHKQVQVIWNLHQLAHRSWAYQSIVFPPTSFPKDVLVVPAYSPSSSSSPDSSLLLL